MDDHDSPDAGEPEVSFADIAAEDPTDSVAKEMEATPDDPSQEGGEPLQGRDGPMGDHPSR